MEEKIAALDRYQESSLFSAQEKAALHFAELLALNHHAFDDDTMRQLRAHFTDPQIIELGMMIGQYIGAGRLLMVLQVENAVCTLD
ncbi:MAG: carboxymuconolactone decarboxylase family protein [Terriglobales bacterium]